MVFKAILSRVIRLFATKTNSLFYVLMYREIQDLVVELAGEMGLDAQELSKEIGKRAARESAERHASVLGLVPINPNNPKKIVSYIEILWNILFGQKLDNYTIEVEQDGDAQKVRFIIGNCPVCMGHEEDVEQYKDMFKAFSGKEVEGYACLMAGMLEELATIIMVRKDMDIRLDIKETSCLARGDEFMAVEAVVVPVDVYEGRKKLDLQLASPVDHRMPEHVQEMADQSTRLFEKIAETLQLEKVDEVFDDPQNYVKSQLEDLVRNKLHFTPSEILEYFVNYEEDLFRVIGYLSVHGLNEMGGVVKQITENYLLSKLLDIIISAFEYGVDSFLPRDVLADVSKVLSDFMEGWMADSSLETVKNMDPRDAIKLVLDGAKMALRDLGAELVGAREAMWVLLKRTNVLEGEEPTKEFMLFYDIYEEASLLAGYVMAIPIRILLTQAYDTVKTPIESLQDVYASSREHFERLFDLIEQVQGSDFSADQERRQAEFRKMMPRVF